ncbi:MULTISPECIES: glycerate kinase family protein [Streptomyces]|uniref:Glycerate kinase n=1 Tax=Streptomyces tsukubensis (strain DSM 42081 / NBRC 108919 / NRRL 18488 / 9993) TaxID=1114943 RepID=I2MX01_STRT9|nr:MULTISPECIES: glycerate kinase [Streptomyces]AZK93708.1 glycerate kinase [Streptomyces tsukubensis]EIF89298.1 glycerate kinase [Streptomyces tsukubensis NRRL18488]MYS64639.1 glycerate kinase [Streptomyces sp. SID5473]QKM70151.1 glycerate kinase [Streptomyces tsukubensis NRRL18488]TAI45869.1 glycerate kinase [Streptomyces tsukubensis]
MLTRFAVAPSGFKESLSAQSAADAIAAGVRRVVPGAEIDLIPLVDGGEGTAEALAAAAGGRLVRLTATGPTGRPVATHFAMLDKYTAVVEMAAVAGLSLVPRDLRDPAATTTYGVGELIRAALDEGAREILVGCGDSGTSDGGAGALQALGARLLTADGTELPYGGRELLRLDRIDVSGLDPRLGRTDIRVACNPFNVLCGERGVARVFGPQKGATPEQVEQLSAALEHWADVLTRDLGVRADLYEGPGTGASGGLGAGLAALGALLLPRFEVLLDHLDLDARLARADLVLTAEGALDHQTTRGKVPAEVARRAKRYGRPVLALAGTIGEGAHQVRSAGVDAYSAILPAPVTLTEALGRGGEFLTDATERALRMVLIGTRIPERQPVGAVAAGTVPGSGTHLPSSVR